MADDRTTFNIKAINAFPSMGYDDGSAAVLRADYKLAQQSGDTRAMQSIQRDLSRVGSGGLSSGNGAAGLANIPGISMADTSESPVPELRSGLAEFSNFGKQISDALFTGEQERQKQNEIQSVATKAQAIALANSTQQRAEATIQEQDVHKQLLKAVGLDVLDPESLLSQEMQREANARSRREELRGKITEMQSVNFFQDPLQWFMVQPQLQQSIAVHNQLADEENTSSSKIAEMQSRATTLHALTPAKNADTIRKIAQSDADAILEQSKAVSAKLAAENAAGNAKMMLDQYTIKKNVFGDLMQITTLEEGIRDRRARAEDSNYFRNLAAEDRAERLRLKQEDDARDSAIVVGINAYRKAISGNQPDITLEDLKRMSPDARKVWGDVVLRGNYGNNYGEAIPFIDRYGNSADAANTGNAAMMFTVRSLRDQAEKAVPTIINAARAQGQTLKEPQALAMAYEQLYARDRNLAIKGADKSNMPIESPYSLDWDGLAQKAALSPTPGLIGTILLDAQKRSPGANLSSTMTARGLLNEVQARVISGAVSPKEASENLSRFMGLATSAQYMDAGLKYLALPQITDYTITPGSRGNKKVDLMNPTQVENYLTSQLSSAKAQVQSATQTMTPFGSTNLFNTD